VKRGFVVVSQLKVIECDWKSAISIKILFLERDEASCGVPKYLHTLDY